MFDFELEIENLRNDYHSGSSSIAIKALDIFERIVDIYPTSLSNIEYLAEKLKSTKPAMAALQNIISLSLHLLSKQNLPFNFSLPAKNIKQKMVELRKECVDAAFNRIFSRSIPIIIATCSYSSTVNFFFKSAKESGFSFKVNTVESKWNNNSYGDLTAEFCKNQFIDVYPYIDEEFFNAIKESDVFIIGADSFNKTCGVINGIPSAKCAEESYGKIPFFVLAESFKESPKLLITDGFELIKNKYITEIFTNESFIF